MGTNYYAQTISDICQHCGRGNESEKLHIGKSSAGWCFSLHTIPELGILDLPDWQREWAKPGVIILDEYDDVLSPEEMVQEITNRSWPHKSDRTAEYLNANNAVEGPNNLMRHRIGPYCVSHGAGTWDCLSGEFS